MKKTLFTLIPTALVALVSMSGCGSKMGPADTDNLNVNVDTRGVTISIWDPFGATPAAALQSCIDEFSQKTGIIVEHESKGNYGPLNEAIKLATTSKTYPNVALGYPDHFAGYINSNIQLRLDGLIKNDAKREMVGKDEEGFDVDKDGIRKLNYEDFYSSYRTENETLEFRKDGSSYILGMPFNKSTEVMIANMHFFSWVKGQNDLKDKIFVPTTWAEVKSVGVEIRKYLGPVEGGGVGAFGKVLWSDGTTHDEAPEESSGKTVVLDLTSVSADDFRVFSYNDPNNFFITLVRQYGGVYTEIDKTKTGVGYAAFNDEANRAKTLEALAMVRELSELKILGIPDTWTDGKGYCSTPFMNNRTLLNVGSTAGVTKCLGGKVSSIKCYPIPQKAGSEKNYVISQGSNICMLNKGSEKEKVAAWKLMVYLSQQSNGEFCVAGHYFPTCKAATNSKAYQDYLNESFGAGEKLQQDAALVNEITYAKSSWDRYTDPGFLGSSAIRDEVDYIIPHICFPTAGYETDQKILDAAYVVLADYVRK